ncbi:MAG: hypothetical protein E7Z90_06975 [Cyanobacteria bacterium SIG29]|nr:hypothetical protein [Cyanobacteria bacterium SIG29]
MQKIKQIFLNNIYAISLYSRQIAGTLILFVIARYLSVYDYGLFSSYKAIATFILTFACLGYNEYILVSSNKNVHEVKLKITLFLINALAIVLSTSLISIFCPLDMHLIFILVLIRAFFETTFFALILPYFQASNKLKIISYINILYSILVSLLALISFVFKLSLFKFLVLSCLIGFINYIQCSIYLKINIFNMLFKIKNYFYLIDKSIFGYIGVIIAFLLYSQIPSLYVSTFLSKEDAALYFSAFTIAGIIGLLISAQNQKIVPEMMKNTIQNIKKLIKNNFNFVMKINTFIFVLFLLFGKQLLLLIYGQEYYQNGHILLLLFTLGNISLALANIYGAYITASGNQHIKIHMQLEAIIISILVLLLFNKYGVYAASLAYLTSATHVGIRYTLKTKQLLKQNELLKAESN